jgi:hypothetical protein
MVLGFFLYQLKEFSVWNITNEKTSLGDYFNRNNIVKIIVSTVSLILLWLLRVDVMSIFGVANDNGFFFCAIGYMNSSILQSALGFYEKNKLKNQNNQP